MAAAEHGNDSFRLLALLAPCAFAGRGTSEVSRQVPRIRAVGATNRSFRGSVHAFRPGRSPAEYAFCEIEAIVGARPFALLDRRSPKRASAGSDFSLAIFRCCSPIELFRRPQSSTEGAFGFTPDETIHPFFTFRTVAAFEIGPTAVFCATCYMVWCKADSRDADDFIDKFGTESLKFRLHTAHATPPSA